MSTSKIGVKREEYRVRGVCFALYKAKLKVNPVKGLIVSASNGVNLNQKPRFRNSGGGVFLIWQSSCYY